MVEMRWVPLNKSNQRSPVAFRNLRDDFMVLQYRYPIGEELVKTGTFKYPVTKWSEWIDVPTVTDSTV